MASFILLLNRILYLYMCFVMFACALTWVPNINPDYPLFHAIFKAAGFFILPGAWADFSPLVVMLVCAAITAGLGKIYQKYFAKKEPEIVVLTSDEFLEKFKKQNSEDNDNDSNKDN